MSAGHAIIEGWEVHGLSHAAACSGNPHRIRFAGQLEGDVASARERLARLARFKPGTGHDVALGGIMVYFDIYLTQSTMRQLSRYHWVQPISSMSIEHCWHEILHDDFLMKYVDPWILTYLQGKAAAGSGLDYFRDNMPLGTLLGCSYVTNYRQLKTIHKQRRNHPNPAWQVICDWIEKLPHAKELILGE